jgi:hypothetical protein
MAEIPQEAIEEAFDAGVRYGVPVARAQVRVMLEAAAPAILREFAARVLLISEVAYGYRCPRCHGKPVSTPRYGRPYRCGRGHTWTLKRTYDYERSAGGMLRAVAEGKALPPMPPKSEDATPSAPPAGTGESP